MRVFVTGATGFVGSAVVKELLNAGHEVLGLVRSEENAKLLSATGAKVHHGNIEDLESLKSGAAMADAVIHTAFNHDFTRFKASTEHDRLVVAALAEPLKGSDRPLIVTSGIGILPFTGRLALESDRAVNSPNPRVATEEACDLAAENGVRVGVVRLPPSTHGAGDHGFVPMLIDLAREKGVSVYKGEGSNRWPAVHREDAASLYRLAVEKPFTTGARFHAVGEEGVLFRDLAQAIGENLNVPVESKTPEEAAAHFGWFAHFAAMDCAASCVQTKQQLGWIPTQAGLLADLQNGSYFKK